MKSINVTELDQYKDQEVIDIREVDEYEMGHIPYVKNIPMMGLMFNPQQFLVKGKTYYIVCQSGGRSASLCQELEQKGYDVVNVAGGTGNYPGELER